MRLKKKNLILLVITVFLLGSCVGIGVTQLLLGIYTVSLPKEQYNYVKQLEERYGKLDSIYELMQEKYYKKTKDEELQTGMYRGLVAGLNDSYSYYLTEEECDSWMSSTTGVFAGVGVEAVETSERQYYIVGIIPDTPAERAGLQEGDQMLKVDGKQYGDLTGFSNALRGEEGTEVTLTYSRDGKEQDCTLIREEIVEQSIDSKLLEDKIGYIQIRSFQSRTAEDFKTAVSELRKQGASGLVIDLRNNGGGLTDSCIEIADQLLKKGVITYMEDRSGKREYHYSDEAVIDLPYSILINEQTASSSELLAAAVKDSGKKALVGTTTYGKGVVQQMIPFKTGDGIKLTIAQYFSPKGNVIQEKGVTPDYMIQNRKGSNTDLQLKKAIEIVQQAQTK